MNPSSSSCASLLVILTGAVVVAGLLTLLIRKSVLRKDLLDIPNERSLHTVPTPRGGGAAIVLVFTAAIIALTATDFLETKNAMILIGCGAVVALTGFLDDRQLLSHARSRLALHFVAALIAVSALGGLPTLPVFGTDVSLGFFGGVLATIYLVWLLNLFNFMDGIDGISGAEVVSVCGAAAFLIHRTTHDYNIASLPLALTTATFGFLIFNWPPAKIFMGDVGSGFVGFVIGIFSLITADSIGSLGWVWIILLGVFIVDATVTLIGRLVRKQKPHVAHRSHAFQHLALRFGSHKKVTIGVVAVNLVWLFPIAFAVTEGRIDGFAGVLIAYTPLTIAALILGAGTPSTN
jgi:Fuc2NAc and GlcNAc transferase